MGETHGVSNQTQLWEKGREEKNGTMKNRRVGRFNLTRQGEYEAHPAEAARISWRFALVNRESTAEKISVETSKMPIHTTFERLVLSVTERW